MIKRMCMIGLASLVVAGGYSQSSDAQKMGIPTIHVPNAPRVAKLVRGGTASDLQNGAVLQTGDKLDNYGGADIDVMIDGLGMIRVKPKSVISLLTTPKPNARTIVILEKGSMMCWAKYNPTQYKFIATSGPVSLQMTSGQGTSFMMKTTRQPLKQPNLVTVLCGTGSVRVSMPEPESSAWVMPGQILTVDTRSAVGQAGKPNDYEKKDLRELRQSPF